MSGRYGERPPWHDVQLQLRGPVVGALDTTFRERWTARAPLNVFNPLEWLRDRFQDADVARRPLPEQPSDPPPCGPHAVQVLRTYGDALINYEFAKQGERVNTGVVAVVPLDLVGVAADSGHCDRCRRAGRDLLR